MGTTRWTAPPKNRVSSGRRLFGRGIAALGRCSSTAEASSLTPYSSGWSLRTITSPPRTGRKPIPVIRWPWAAGGEGAIEGFSAGTADDSVAAGGSVAVGGAVTVDDSLAATVFAAESAA